MRTSVIIPAWNAEAFVAGAIDSVLQQTRPVHEILVVDDGSTDRTADVAVAYGAPVRVLRQTNAGPSAARNLALQHVSGDAVAFLDADDLWLPDKLERQVTYLDTHPDVGTVAASFVRFGADRSDQVVSISDRALRGWQPIDFLSSTRIHQSTVLCRSGIIQGVRYPIDIRDAEDTIFSALLRARAPIGGVEDVLMRRREHPAQATKVPDQFARGLQARIEWARANYAVLGLASPSIAAGALLRGAVDDVMAPYWTRDAVLFRDRRRQLIGMWPAGEPLPAELGRRLLPMFALRLRDRLFGA